MIVPSPMAMTRGSFIRPSVTTPPTLESLYPSTTATLSAANRLYVLLTIMVYRADEHPSVKAEIAGSGLLFFGKHVYMCIDIDSAVTTRRKGRSYRPSAMSYRVDPLPTNCPDLPREYKLRVGQSRKGIDG